MKEQAVQILSKVINLSKKQIESLLETPPDPKLGDLAFPCFTLGKKPGEVAVYLRNKLIIPKGSIFKRIEVGGPYLNFFVDEGKYAQIIKKVEKYFGKSVKGKGKKVMVEFCHVNTHKAMHVGHLRTTLLGEALSRILETTGYKVIRANYQGDVGPHVAKCLWAYLKKHKGKSPKGEASIWLGKLYLEGTDAYESSKNAKKEIDKITNQIYAEDPKIMPVWRKTRKWSLESFDKVYKQLGIKFNRLYFESEVHKPGTKIAKKVYKQGIAEISDGALVINLKPYKLGIFLLLRSDGAPLYSTKDFGLAKLQYKEYHPNLVIHVVAVEQKLYFEQLFKTLEKIKSPLAGKEYHLCYETINLASGKMASRSEGVITYHVLINKAKELLLKEIRKRNKKISIKIADKVAEKLAVGALKYIILRRSNNKIITFDWKEALSFEGETGPYLQYALVRAKKILQKGGRPDLNNLELLTEPQEFELIKKIALFPQVVEKAAESYSPHIVANYAYELAQLFSSFYEKCPVIRAEKKVKGARLALVKAFAQTLKNALYLLGVEEVERM